MTTQDFLSNLYTLTYRNVEVRQSSAPLPRTRASTTLTDQPQNPDKSIGDSVDGYRSPEPIVSIYPASIPPRFRERNVMNPLETEVENNQLRKVAPPDPRINPAKKKYDAQLENMNIQIAPFNYNAIFGIAGILFSVVLVVWLARGRK